MNGHRTKVLRRALKLLIPRQALLNSYKQLPNKQILRTFSAPFRALKRDREAQRIVLEECYRRGYDPYDPSGVSDALRRQATGHDRVAPDAAVERPDEAEGVHDVAAGGL